jgi:hypothetical protein
VPRVYEREVCQLADLVKNEPVTAETLGLRSLPRGWNGAPLAQLLASARSIVEQGEATGGSGDPRLEAALKVLEYKERLHAGGKKARRK